MTESSTASAVSAAAAAAATSAPPIESKKDSTPSKAMHQSSTTSTTTGGGRSSRHGALKTQSTTTASQYRQLSNIQSQQVDAAFEEIFGYKWGTVFSWSQATAASPDILTSEQIMLGKVLGKKRAAQLLQLHPSIGGTTTATTTFFNNNKDREVIRKHQTYKHKTDTSASPAAKTAAAATKSTNNNTRGMDQLLHEMSTQSNKVTTTAKTAADWEIFKVQAGPGLGDKLEEHAESKGAYLKRQDFLSRVDQRQFEKEKKERDKNRAARDR